MVKVSNKRVRFGVTASSRTSFDASFIFIITIRDRRNVIITKERLDGGKKLDEPVKDILTSGNFLHPSENHDANQATKVPSLLTVRYERFYN